MSTENQHQQFNAPETEIMDISTTTGSHVNQTDVDDLEDASTVNTMDAEFIEEVVPEAQEASLPLEDAASTSIIASQSSLQTEAEPAIADSISSPKIVAGSTSTDAKEATESTIAEPKEADSEILPVAEAQTLEPANTETAEVPIPDTIETTDTTFIAKPILSKKICGVCYEHEAKYRCSRCEVRFCSLPCSNVHKSSHPKLEPQPNLPPKPKVEEAKTKEPRPGTVAAAGHIGPFAPLDGSKELQELFKIYPRLPSLLDEIDKKTLRPTSSNSQNGFKGPYRRKEEPWNADVGLKKGIDALKQARNSSGDDGKSLREYSRLVLQILSLEEQSASELLQQEQAKENARIIQQLLQGER